MSYPKLAQFVQLLTERTADGSLQWVRTEEEGTFLAAFPRYSVRIFEQYDVERDEQDMVIEILDENGDRVERFSDVQIKQVMSNSYPAMYAMYQVARRQALGVESALDELISSLRTE